MTDTTGLANRTEASFDQLVDSIQDYAIFMLDPHGIIVSWNRGAERMKGYRSEKIIGKHFSIFYTDEDKQRRHPENELEIVRRDERYEESGWRVRKDGSRFWASVVITALRNDQGNLIGFGKVTRDLTAARLAEDELRQSEERLRLLIEGVRDYAIFMLDADGIITSWNTGAERLKGYKSQEIIGRHFSIFYSEEDRRRGHPQQELAAVRRDGRYEEENWRFRKDGSAFWANVVISPIYDDAQKLRGYAKVTRDLTEKHRTESQRQEVEDRLSIAAEKIHEARLAVQLRDEFIFVAAHELRTPLAALTLKTQGAERLLSESAPLAPQVARAVDRLKGANKQIVRLRSLIERLLDVSRIAHGRLELNSEEANLVKVAGDVIEELGETARSSGSPICLDAPQALRGRWDIGRLAQIFTNLVSNGIKYGGGSCVTVKLSGTDDTVVIRVEDKGPGIAPEHLDRIFDRFERGAAPLSDHGGLGLGLYITRHLVEAHDGTISVGSTLGQGAVFEVALPRHLETSE